MKTNIVGQVLREIIFCDWGLYINKDSYIIKTEAEEYRAGNTALSPEQFDYLVKTGHILDCRVKRQNDRSYEQTFSMYFNVELLSQVDKEFWQERGLSTSKITSALQKFLIINHGLVGKYEIENSRLNDFLFGMAICLNQDLWDGWIYQDWEKFKGNLKQELQGEIDYMNHMIERKVKEDESNSPF